MDYIRRARGTETWWSPELRHVFYGLDADLIMLALVTHEKNFMLLREKMSVRHGATTKDPIQYGREDFELLEISLLRKLLNLQFVSLEDPKKFPFALKLERVIDDFVFLCFLIGNDFLPHVAHLNIADGSLTMMMNSYKKMLPTIGGYLTNKTHIYLARVELFCRELSKHEANYFERRGAEEHDDLFADPQRYREHYYRSKFGWEVGTQEGGALVRKLVHDFVTGLHWCLEYYHNGVGSWDWYFPHLYAPLASDLLNLTAIEFSFARGRPFTPLMQLLAVLPATSGRLLPPPYRDLMTKRYSPLAEFYPADFQIDQNGKSHAWEAVVKIPFLDEACMLDVLKSIDHKRDLSPEERLRNAKGEERRFDPSRVAAAPGAAATSKQRRPRAVQKGRDANEEALTTFGRTMK